MKKPRRGER